jgi:hypothetical protein
MIKPIVWVVKEQVSQGNAMDYSPAIIYGDIRFITRSDMPLHPNSSVQSVWSGNVARFVEEYDESRDFIITTGQPTAIFATGHALGLARKVPRYLVWRREDNRYRVLDIATANV